MSFDFNSEILKQDLGNSNIVDKILIDQVVQEFKKLALLIKMNYLK